MPLLPKGYLPTSYNYQENNPEPASKAIKKANIAEGNLDVLGACNGLDIFYMYLRCQPIPTAECACRWGGGGVLPHSCF